MGKWRVLLKILFCVNYYLPQLGGSEIVVHAIAKYLAQKQHEVFVLTRKLPKRTSAVIDNVKILEYAAADPINIIKTIDSIKPDSILVYSDVFDYLRYLLPLKYKLSIALCGANWIYQSGFHANLFKKHLNNVHKLICHSKFERDFPFCQNLAKDKTVIIPNGIHLEEFDNNSISRADLAPDLLDKRWILNVSNFFPGKGQEHLIPILSQLQTKNLAYIQLYNEPDFIMAKQLEQNWLHSVENLKSKNIIVRAFKNLPREKVIAFFKNSNVFAFTSEKEVSPIVLLEAMAAKLPWVATNVGNAEELLGGKVISTIKDSNYYSVFNSVIIRSFSKAVDDIFSSGKELSGREQIEQRYNWAKILPEYENILL